MSDSSTYWTTREVATDLRLHEKKIHKLVAEAKLPAARISGTWLLEKALVDRWVQERTVYPEAGVLAGLLERALDWLSGPLAHQLPQPALLRQPFLPPGPPR